MDVRVCVRGREFAFRLAGTQSGRVRNVQPFLWSVGHNRKQKVPHLRRSHGTPGQAGSSSIDAPALPGWADVWRAGPPGLGSGWILFCGSLTQELIKLWHCQQPVKQSSQRANWDQSDAQASVRDFHLRLPGLLHELFNSGIRRYEQILRWRQQQGVSSGDQAR